MSHWGSTVLFNIFEDSAKPFTLEALLYGMNMGLMFLCMVIWFLGFSKIMTTDKFTYIFGRFFPAISLTFTMILRLLPFIKKRTAEISEGQKAIKAENANPTVISTEAETVNFHVISTEAENANFHVISTEAKTVNFHVISTGARSAKWRNPPKLAEMISLFTAVFSSTLEDGISTAETMENRGWGKCRRTCFLSYRFRISDALLSIVLMLLYGILIFCEVNGGSTMGFYPTVNFSIKGNIFLIPEIAAYSGEMILLTIFCRK
ncbi:MAG: hypothetical protein KBT11_02260 [Treponema sp.]|nr:hypothetical protein [Candidatus Treponema equifaecale]